MPELHLLLQAPPLATLAEHLGDQRDHDVQSLELLK